MTLRRITFGKVDLARRILGSRRKHDLIHEDEAIKGGKISLNFLPKLKGFK